MANKKYRVRVTETYNFDVIVEVNGCGLTAEGVANSFLHGEKLEKGAKAREEGRDFDPTYDFRAEEIE